MPNTDVSWSELEGWLWDGVLNFDSYVKTQKLGAPLQFASRILNLALQKRVTKHFKRLTTCMSKDKKSKHKRLMHPPPPEGKFEQYQQ